MLYFYNQVAIIFMLIESLQIKGKKKKKENQEIVTALCRGLNQGLDHVRRFHEV